MSVPSPWHQKQWQVLEHRVQQNKLPHALLFVGPSGSGKRQLANFFAQSLLCEATGAFAVFCNVCRSCELFNSGTHPDFHLISPEEDSKIIKIDAIRKLCEINEKTSQRGKYKIVVIEPAEAMNTASANALLKTLEEPTKDSLFILVSHRVHQLPATLRSRCESIPLSVPLEHQQTNVSTTEKECAQDLLALISREKDPLTLAEKWHKSNADITLFCLVDTVGNLIRTKFLTDVHYTDNQEEIKNLLLYLEKIYEAIRQVQSKNNSNMLLLLEELFIGAHQLKR